MCDLQTSRYAEADRAGVTCRDSQSGDDAIKYPDRYFRWQFVDNPWAGERSPEIWVCKDNGRIVGQMAGVAVQVKVNDRIIPGSWIHDLLVHPEFRGRGIAHRLGKASAEDNSIVLGLGMGEPTARVFYRMGCSDFGTIPVYARLFRCEDLLQRRFGGVLGRLIGFPANAFLRMLSTLHSAALKCRAMRLEEVEWFDERADSVWEMASPHYPVLCLRNARQLNWRFAAPLVKPHYSRFFLMRGHDALGYVVLSRETVNGINAAVIVDYLCTPAIRPSLFAACISLCRAWGVTAVFCTHLCEASRSELLWQGFVRRPKSGKRFIVSVRGLDDETSCAVLRRDNWFVTRADSDAHRPGNIRGTSAGAQQD